MSGRLQGMPFHHLQGRLLPRYARYRVYFFTEFRLECGITIWIRIPQTTRAAPSAGARPCARPAAPLAARLFAAVVITILERVSVEKTFETLSSTSQRIRAAASAGVRPTAADVARLAAKPFAAVVITILERVSVQELLKLFPLRRRGSVRRRVQVSGRLPRMSRVLLQDFAREGHLLPR